MFTPSINNNNLVESLAKKAHFYSEVHELPPCGANCCQKLTGSDANSCWVILVQWCDEEERYI